MNEHAWPMRGLPPQLAPEPALSPKRVNRAVSRDTRQTVPMRTAGATTKIYHVTNNFERYTTLERPSQEYINNYISYCMVNKGMELKRIKFEIEEIEVFMTNSRIGRL